MVTMAWEARAGRCRGRGRTAASRHGLLSLLLALALVGVPHKAVSADLCQNGYDEDQSPRHHGDLVEWRAQSNRSKGLQVRGAPGLFQRGAPKPKRGGDKVPCCNPRCPGVAGRQSFKWDYAVGRGQNGTHCVACNMSWERSWDVHYNGAAPPTKGSKYGGLRWADYEDDDWEDDEPGASPAYDALDDVYKGLLAQIIALPDEAARQETIDHFKEDDSPMGKAMLAAYAETMATKQAVERPVLKHPAGDPAGVVDGLRKERNKAENLDRQAAANLQRKNLQLLAIQERIAQAQKEMLQTQKEQAEAVALKEETSRDFALKDQQLQAAMAHRERELLLQTGAQATTLPEPFAGPGQFDEQAKQLVEAVASLATMVRKVGCSNLQPLLGCTGTGRPCPGCSVQHCCKRSSSHHSSGGWCAPDAPA